MRKSALSVGSQSSVAVAHRPPGQLGSRHAAARTYSPVLLSMLSDWRQVSCPRMKLAYLSICAIFKDEAPYLPEWIEFHRLVGVERFFLYDNLSSRWRQGGLEPWVRAGVVSISDCSIPLGQGGQGWAYADALRRARGRTRWLAFIDVDEFLFSPGPTPLPDVLAGV